MGTRVAAVLHDLIQDVLLAPGGAAGQEGPSPAWRHWP